VLKTRKNGMLYALKDIALMRRVVFVHESCLVFASQSWTSLLKINAHQHILLRIVGQGIGSPRIPNVSQFDENSTYRNLRIS
jgi:hypothetical protein